MRHPLLIGSILLLLTSLAPGTPAALNARDFGAVADGATDDTAAIQRALDEAGKTGARVMLPPGRYLVAGHLVLPESVTLEGSFKAPARTIFNTGTLEKEKGTLLLATAGHGDPDARPFIQLHRNSTLAGLAVFYPNQTFPIVEYPWTIRGAGDNCSIRDVLLVNPYRAVDFGTHPCGRHFISGLYAHALKEGLFVDKCFDVGRIENVHFWPFWKDEARILDWTRAHGTAFRFARTDWEYVSNSFCIAYAVGFHFTAGADGPGNVVLSNTGSDIGPVAVRVDASQHHAGISFVTGQIMAGVEIADTNDGPVKFTACGFWGAGQTASHVVSRSKGQVTLNSCHFISWDQRNDGAPAIVADNGALVVTACEFLDREPAKTHVRLGGTLESAIITSNRFRSDPKIVNNSKAAVSIESNVGPAKR